MRTAAILSLFVTLWAATEVAAKPTPDAERQGSFPISAASTARIEALDGRQLADDSVFVATLRAVLTDERFSSAEKSDAFYLMLRKIGWDFTGTAWVPPRRNYFNAFNRAVFTYASYQEAIADLEYDPTELLALASGGCGEHVVRCSHALLLSAIVNPRTSKPTIESLLEVAALRRAEVPAILRHNLALAAVLTRDVSLVARLGTFLSEVEGEEEQEDILSAVGMFDTPQMTLTVTSFLKQALKTKFDSAVETALYILHRQLQGRAFEQVYADLLAVPTETAWRTRLIELQQNDFAPLRGTAEGRAWIKIWDGFSVHMYDDGMVVVYGGRFRDFKPM